MLIGHRDITRRGSITTPDQYADFGRYFVHSLALLPPPPLRWVRWAFTHIWGKNKSCASTNRTAEQQF